MQSNRKQTGIFSEIEIPEQFEIDLELHASASPRFAMAFGRDKLSAASNESLRVETWGDELVVVQDKVFEPVMTIAKDAKGQALDNDRNGRIMANNEGKRSVWYLIHDLLRDTPETYAKEASNASE